MKIDMEIELTLLSESSGDIVIMIIIIMIIITQASLWNTLNDSQSYSKQHQDHHHDANAQ